MRELERHFVVRVSRVRFKLRIVRLRNTVLYHCAVWLSDNKSSFSHDTSKFIVQNFNLEFGVSILKWDWLRGLLLCIWASKVRLGHKIIRMLFVFFCAFGIVYYRIRLSHSKLVVLNEFLSFNISTCYIESLMNINVSKWPFCLQVLGKLSKFLLSYRFSTSFRLSLRMFYRIRFYFI